VLPQETIDPSVSPKSEERPFFEKVKDIFG
jgi:hypothetical protein